MAKEKKRAKKNKVGKRLTGIEPDQKPAGLIFEAEETGGPDDRISVASKTSSELKVVQSIEAEES